MPCLDAPVRVLLVEDEALIGMALAEQLEEAGFRVLLVTSAEEATGILRNRQQCLSAFVTDIRLGEGLDGWELGTQARQLWPNIPVVYMSGDSAAGHAIYGVPQSVMLQKPFAAAQMVTAISTLLNER